MGKCKAKAIQTDLGTFRHNQAYPGIIQACSGTFKALCDPGIIRTVIYPELWHIQNQRHIQNSGIFKIQSIFKTLSNIYDEVFCENSERL